MAYIAVWLDSEHAKIVTFQGGDNPLKQEVKRHGARHHADVQGGHHHDLEPYFHEIAEHLKSAQEVLVLGPGTAKDKFRQHLRDHHHGDVDKKIVGFESADHPTDNQIAAHARKYFKHLHFNGL